MQETLRVYYWKDQAGHGRLRKNINWDQITRKSVVLISASEAFDLDPNQIAAEESATFNLGDADVYVTNISPHDGGVEFILHVNWDEPLNVMVDITVLDAYEQFFVV